MEAVWIALIVATGGAATTILTVWLTGRQVRAGKDQDYKRQDEVAAQAAEAAKLLAERQDAAEAKADEVVRQAAEAARLNEERQDAIQKQTAEAAKLLLAANERVAEQSAHASEVTNGKLNQIHELVNSNLTVQMSENHQALMQQFILMKEIIRLNRLAGQEPSQEALDAAKAIAIRINELGAQLNDRAKATEIADKKVHDGA